jgi:hypothetical protein
MLFKKGREMNFVLGGSTMTVQKARSAWVLMGILILLQMVCLSDAKEVYKWVDDKGTVHFSEDESSIPEKYKQQIEKKSMLEEAKATEEKRNAGREDGKKGKGRVAVKEKEKVDKNRIEGDVIESVKTVLSLWKDGKYNALYDCGDQKSRRTIRREDFEHRMRKKAIGLASSWETLRDIQVAVESSILAYATVRIGFKPKKGGETIFRTETYRLPFEKGMWRISLQKILQTKP